MKLLLSKSMAVSRSLHISTPNLNNLINSFIRNGNINGARTIFDDNVSTRNTASWNLMIMGYIRYNQTLQAHELFDKMPVRDVVSWNTMLSSFNKIKDPHGVCLCYLHMGRAHQTPNEVTFSLVLSAVSKTPFSVVIPQLHGLILHLGLNSSVFVGSALMKGYTSLGDQQSLCLVFDDMLLRDISSWNALILGYMDLGFTNMAQKAFDMMPEANIISWTTMVDGYIKNRKLKQARFIFDMMSERNVVSWTSMMKGYVQYGRFVDALDFFLLMHKSAIHANHFTLSVVLDACAGCSSLVMGNQVHSCILKSGFPLDVILLTSLVDMYGKCGDIEAAFYIFESMPKKNLVSWNSIIGGYARHGLGRRAVEEFERMTKGGVKPDKITLVNVLSACGHGGLVEEGERHFWSMRNKYGIEAEKEHYACMVDLYGRAGELEKAKRVVKGMPFEADVVVWGALLAACGLHSCSKLGEFAAEGLRKLEQRHSSVHSVMLKIHGENGVWGGVNEIRSRMKERGGRKQKAGSWIEFASH